MTSPGACQMKRRRQKSWADGAKMLGPYGQKTAKIDLQNMEKLQAIATMVKIMVNSRSDLQRS